MEQGFSILMFIFSGALLLYAVLLAITKDYDMLPRRGAVPVKPENRKEYTFQISKVIALTALAPAAGGLAGLYYGDESIPQQWLDALAKREEICRMCEAFHANAYEV